MKRKRNWRRFGVTMLIGLLAGIGVFSARSGFSLTEWPEIAAALCDACFVPAAMLISVGLLLFVSNDGLFNMISYGVQKVARLVLSAKRQADYPKTYYEYWERKQAAGKTSFGFLIVAGLVWLASATAFLLLSGAV